MHGILSVVEKLVCLCFVMEGSKKQHMYQVRTYLVSYACSMCLLRRLMAQQARCELGGGISSVSPRVVFWRAHKNVLNFEFSDFRREVNNWNKSFFWKNNDKSTTSCLVSRNPLLEYRAFLRRRCTLIRETHTGAAAHSCRPY